MVGMSLGKCILDHMLWSASPQRVVKILGRWMSGYDVGSGAK